MGIETFDPKYDQEQSPIQHYNEQENPEVDEEIVLLYYKFRIGTLVLSVLGLIVVTIMSYTFHFQDLFWDSLVGILSAITTIIGYIHYIKNKN